MIPFYKVSGCDSSEPPSNADRTGKTPPALDTACVPRTHFLYWADYSLLCRPLSPQKTESFISSTQDKSPYNLTHHDVRMGRH